jgi:hypothetical protein
MTSRVDAQGNTAINDLVIEQRRENNLETARAEFGYIPNPHYQSSMKQTRQVKDRPEPKGLPDCISWTKDSSHQCRATSMPGSPYCSVHRGHGHYDPPEDLDDTD